MSEGMRWLSRQLAWEDAFDECRRAHEAEQDAMGPTVLPMRQPVISAPTAGELVGGDHFEAA
jgi:hypothetical protein